MQTGVTLVTESTAGGARLDRMTSVSPSAAARWEPAILFLLAAVVAVYASVNSVGWVGRTFPGFLLMENAIVPSVSGRGWPEDKSALFHSRVVRVDGQPVASSADVYSAAAVRPEKTAVDYAFEKGGREFARTIATRRFNIGDYVEVYGILLLIAWMNVVTGIAVAVMRPDSRQAKIYTRLTFVGCLFAATPVFLHQSGFPVLTNVYLAAESFFPAFFIHLALVFPVERSFRGAGRLWIGAPYAVAAALTIAKLHGFHQVPPDLGAVHASYLFNAAAFVFFVGSLVHCYRENRGPEARLRLKALLPSVVIGGTLSALAFADNSLSGGTYPLQLGLLFVPLFYASLAYAIAKHDLFDIDRMVRRSFAYGLLTLAVAGAYALLVALPARLSPAVSDLRTLIGLAFVLMLAFMLEPLRRAAQHVVDRAFYRTQLSYQPTIGGLSEVLTTLLSLSAIVERVTHVLTESMQLDFAAVWLAGDPPREARLWTRRPRGPLVEENPDPALGGLLDAVNESEPEGHPRGHAEQWLADAGAALLLPLRVRGKAIGLLVFGGKRSGQPFGSDDVEILRTLAHSTAVAAGNALAVHALEELSSSLEATVRQRTAELSHAYEELQGTQVQLVQSEKMASLGRLVAGVAHELNNPASFVHGSLANLAEYLSRLLTLLEAYERARIDDPANAESLRELGTALRIDYVREETPRMLRICSEGSQRIKKIVDDLRVFARADRGVRAPVDVAEGIESTLTLLADRITQAGIEVRKGYQPVAPLEAEAGLLNQVWMNLLVNAIDAMEGRAVRELRIAVRGAGASRESSAGNRLGAVEVEIADTGSGIEAADIGRIFEPFFTTKPIGRGTGLGLSTAYSAVKSHGGSIEVASTPGSGTTFMIRLPSSQRSV